MVVHLLEGFPGAAPLAGGALRRTTTMATTTETTPLAQRIINAIHERQPLEQIQKLGGGAPAVQLALLHL